MGRDDHGNGHLSSHSSNRKPKPDSGYKFERNGCDTVDSSNHFDDNVGSDAHGDIDRANDAVYCDASYGDACHIHDSGRASAIGELASTLYDGRLHNDAGRLNEDAYPRFVD